MRSLLLFAGLSVTASAANAVAIVNGSFEMGITPVKSALLLAGDRASITGWKVFVGNVDLDDTATGGWDASDGVKSIDLSGVAPGGIQQTVTGLTAGVAYQITFDLSGSYNWVRTSPNNMSVVASGNVKQYYSYDLDNTVTNMMYQAETYTFVATGTKSVLKFNGLDKSNYGAVLDNVGIRLAPPGSLPLGGIGALPLGGVGTVPEPASWAMMLAGFGLVGLSVRRRAGNRSVTA